MNDELLSINGLSVLIRSPRGHVHAAVDVSVALASGEIVGVVGESGSGKSTLLRATIGLLPRSAEVTAGTLVFDGREVPLANRKMLGRLRGDISMIFQEPMTALNPIMSVGDQVAEAPRRRLGLSRRAARQRAIELMKDVGIPAAERRYQSYPHELSGGLRQRVLIAAALSAEPRVLLCDEPTTALDVTIQRQILDLLASLRDRLQLGILYVSHDLAVIAEVCDRIEVMYAGRVVEAGKASQVFDTPHHAYTLELLRALPDYRTARARFVSIPGSPPSLVDPPPGCPFHPRCSFATDRCKKELPPATVIDERRVTCCHHWPTVVQHAPTLAR